MTSGVVRVSKADSSLPCGSLWCVSNGKSSSASVLHTAVSSSTSDTPHSLCIQHHLAWVRIVQVASIRSLILVAKVMHRFQPSRVPLTRSCKLKRTKRNAYYGNFRLPYACALHKSSLLVMIIYVLAPNEHCVCSDSYTHK